MGATVGVVAGCTFWNGRFGMTGPTSAEGDSAGDATPGGAASEVLPGLRRTAARYQALIEATTLDVWHTDADGGVIDDMPGWRAITGQTIEEIHGDGWVTAVHLEDAERARTTWEKAFANQSLYECEYRLMSKDGGHRVIFARGVPILEDGRVVEWVGTSEDVTDRRRDERSLREHSAAIDKLNAIGATLAAELDLHELMQAITDATTELTGAQFGALFYTEAREGEENFTLVTISGVPKERFENFPMPRNTEVFAPTFRGEGVVRLDDVTQDPRYGRNAPYHGLPEGHLPVRSYLAVPVVSKSGHVHGGLFFGHERPGVFTGAHERLVRGVAAQAAAALDNAALYEAERRSRAVAEAAQRDLAFLARANYALSASLDFARTADVVTKLPVPDLCDWAVLHVVTDGGHVEAVSVHHADEAKCRVLRDVVAHQPVRTEQRGGPGAAIRTGRSVVVDEVTGERLDAYEPDAQRRAALRGAGVGSLLSVPLLTRDRVVGALTLVRETPRAFGARVVAVAEELTSRAALALDSAMLFSRERAAALTLQRSLLPGALPPVEGTVCAVRYLPGAAGLEVGGDWYDVIPVSAGVVVYVIGDVMGRGVQAAGVMGQLRAAVRAYALDDHQPEEVLRRVNRLLCLSEEPPLVTCAYARVDIRTGELCISTAGHLPPMLLPSDGEPEYLELEPGLPLGVGESDFASGCRMLPAGSTLVLYTDGLVETPQSSITTGMARLCERARAASGETDIEALTDALLGPEHTADHSDDVAVLVVRLSPIGAAGVPGSCMTDTLPPEPSSVGKARQFVERAVGEWAVGVDLDDAKLLVSELVTNALIHTGTLVHLQVELRDDVLRVSVDDEGAPGSEVPTGGELPGVRLSVGGRGLAIVAVLAHRWGVEPQASGKRVWFELATS